MPDYTARSDSALGGWRPIEAAAIERFRDAVLWQLGVTADNFERAGRDADAKITRWHMAWIKVAIVDPKRPTPQNHLQHKG